MAAKKGSAKKAPARKAPTQIGGKVTSAQVRMYRLGTGDCFVIKFLSGKNEVFKMMIDCGSWSGTKARFEAAVTDLKKHVANQVDVLVVTHEHKDHVLGFEHCESMFTTGFKVGETWLSWAEDDSSGAVKTLKSEHGAKKMALAKASTLMADAIGEMAGVPVSTRDALANFSTVVKNFSSLNMELAADGSYAGPLKGMTVVKDQIVPNSRVRYFTPGEIVEDINGLQGIRIHVLGPPSSYDTIKVGTSKQEGEVYDHNAKLRLSDSFAAALLNDGSGVGNLPPFDRAFECPMNPSHAYHRAAEDWRRIDNDWLMSAGSLALRLTSGINNLSLALAIEFIDSGRVMLFPGDAEYGSWASWHGIDWGRNGSGKHPDGKPKHLTEDLLNRTVFYKVAHHISDHGTARRLGLEMMTHKDLAAMATLDYSGIGPGWKNTMPNKGILTDLLKQAKGRLMVMNLEGLAFQKTPRIELKDQIEESQKLMSFTEREAFENATAESDLWIDFTVKG